MFHVGGAGMNAQSFSHFLCVPLAAAVEVALTIAMKTAGTILEHLLKLESSQRVLSVPNSYYKASCQWRNALGVLQKPT